MPAKGGGITATPAASADGEDLYVASVGCLSFPSVGNSDSMFKMDAATGAIDWVYRSRTTEQFTTFPGGPTYREAQLCMEMIHDSGLLCSLDIMELNPAYDHKNATAELVVELTVADNAPKGLVKGELVVKLNHPLITEKRVMFNGFVR